MCGGHRDGKAKRKASEIFISRSKNKGRDIYSLIFADFPLFSESREVISSFSVRSDKPPHFPLSDHLRMVFVDLSKFSASRGLKALVDTADLWCYILKRSVDMSQKELEDLARKSEGMKMAMDHLKRLSQDRAVRFQEEMREKFYKDFVAGKETAIRRSRQEGLEQGREEGREEGRQEGREEGREEERKAFILNMLQQKADISFIAKVTGISEEEIKQLKNRR